VDIVVPRELLNQRYRTQRTFSVVVAAASLGRSSSAASGS
jgi:hypothetical protein